MERFSGEFKKLLSWPVFAIAELSDWFTTKYVLTKQCNHNSQRDFPVLFTGSRFATISSGWVVVLFVAGAPRYFPRFSLNFVQVLLAHKALIRSVNVNKNLVSFSLFC